MRLSDLPAGRYEISIACSGPCQVCKVWEFGLPSGNAVLPKDEELEDLFNAGRMRCKSCRSPAHLLHVESIHEYGSKRETVLRLEGWRPDMKKPPSP